MFAFVALEPPVDVVFREWWVSLYPESLYVSGAMEIHFVPSQALDTLPLWLGVEHQVDSVLLNGNLALFCRDSNRLWILAEVLPGETAVAKVFYRGKPSAGLYSESIRKLYYSDIGSMTDPVSYHLFPCFSYWNKKAPLVAHYSVPIGFKVVANGTLSGVDTSGDRVWFHWTANHPIAVHYITFLASPELLEGGFVHNGINIKLYAHPLDTHKLNLAAQFFPEMIDYYESLLKTPFPFSDEKCGFTCLGYYMDGMEYQTLIFLGVLSYDTSARAQEKQAHELFHQWFGNFVTPARQSESWLAEGPATYFGLLYTLHTRGRETFLSRMREHKNLYLSDESQFGALPLADADPSHPSFCSTVYGKGAWVLHTLRFITGDSVFFEIMRRFLQNMGEGTAVSADLERSAQEAYGDVSWFFEQWVFNPGHPVFMTSWQQADDTIIISIEQVQPMEFPTYTLPVEVAFYGADTFLLDTLWTSSRADTFVVSLGFSLDSVKFDPNEWILAEWESVEVREGSPPSSFPGVVSVLGASEIALATPATLWDASGRLVRKFKPPRASLRGLKPGVYLLLPKNGRPVKLTVVSK